MVVFYGRAGRLNAQNGGSRPGQIIATWEHCGAPTNTDLGCKCTSKVSDAVGTSSHCDGVVIAWQ
jgi:hypothetical protein